MISRPDQKVLQAVAGLQGNQNFIIFLKYLEGCMLELDRSGRLQPEDYKMRLNAGGAQVIEDILKLSEDSKQLRR